MGLMYATGPLGPSPAGEFNFEPPPAAQALYLEPTPRRVRVVLGGETIADSHRAFLLHEGGHQPTYYFPPEDVRTDLFSASDRHTRCPKKGEASYYDIAAGGKLVEGGAWYYPEVLPGAPPRLAGLIAFYWGRMDHWYEEDEEVFGHARDPYHRIDVLASARHVRVSLDGELLAESDRAIALFECGLPTRWYLPREDVVASLIDSDTVTLCPYKGTASYYSVEGVEDSKDLVWYYPDPHPEVGRIAGLVCFYNEQVDIELDGELAERPATPFRHAAAKSAAA